MLNYPPDSRPYRIVGIDPGTDTLGAAVLDVFLGTKQVVLVEAHTFSGEQLSRAYPYLVHYYGDRVARMTAHEDNLYGYFMYCQPHSVVAESPFLRKFPQAFAALTEMVSHIRRAVMRYNNFMPLLTVDPPTAKLTVGVSGKGKTKDDVKQGLVKLIASGQLLNPYGIDILALDEHAVDSIVVGLTRANYIRTNF